MSFQLRKVRAPLLFALLLGVLCLNGMATYKHYGISNDEWDDTWLARSNIALITERYLQGDFSDPYDFIDRDLESYGTFFSLLAYPFQLLAVDGDLSRIQSFASHQAKHLVIFFFAFFAYLALYDALRIATRNRTGAALLSVGILATMPYFYGHAFMNPRDIPFAAFYTLSTLYLSRTALLGYRLSLVSANSSHLRAYCWRVLITGVLTGLTASIRSPALAALPFAWMALASGAIVFSGHPLYRLRRKLLLPLISWLAGFTVAALTVWILHPASYFRPLQWAYDTLTIMANHHQNYFCMWYDNVPVRPHSIPWHYVPAWLYIKTPILWLSLTVTGVLFSLQRLVRQPWNGVSFLQAGFLLQLLFFPLSAMLLGSTLYNGIRHLLFIYPAMAFFSGYAVIKIWSWLHFYKKKAAPVFACLVCAYALHTVVDMIKLHPYQYVYFNEITRFWPIEQHWDTDYFRISSVEIAEHLIETGSSRIPLKSGVSHWKHNLTPYLPGNIRLVEGTAENEAAYVLLRHGYCAPYTLPRNCTLLHNISRSLSGQKIPIAQIGYCPAGNRL